MKRPIALLFCLLMITMPLAGCFGGDDSSDAPDEELDDWNVHFAATAADLPTCDEDTSGRLYYVEADNQFQVCKSSGWSVIDIQGSDGAAGNDGQDGLSGADGQDGANGTSIVINAKPTKCGQYGGEAFDIGEDANADGVLDATEVVISVDICNGYDGRDGMDPPTSLIDTTEEPAGNNCANGGVKIEAGVDDNFDGKLYPEEVDTTQYICDGGSSATTMLTSYSPPSTSMGCDVGGSIISHGLDNGDGGGTAANGQLEAGELDYSTTFCTKSTFVRVDGNNDSPSGGYILSNQIIFNNELYFSGYDSAYGYELWKYDGINAPSVVADIRIGTAGSYPNQFTIFNNELYFTANNGIDGTELYMYDGINSPELIDIVPGNYQSSSPSELTVFNDELYFSANGNGDGYELWKYDGVNAPTIVADIHPGQYSSYPRHLTVFDNRLYFRAYEVTYGIELWAYNGVNAPYMVADIYPGQSHSEPTDLIVFNNSLYFQADDGISGTELWRYDGINAPSMVFDIRYGSDGSGASQFVEFNNELFFTANDDWRGTELWKYDGVNNPGIVSDIRPSLFSSNPSSLTFYDNALYFGADDGIHGQELWKYDGTNAPSMVADINTGQYGSEPGGLISFNGDLCFYATNSMGVDDFWKYTQQTTITYA